MQKKGYRPLFKKLSKKLINRINLYNIFYGKQQLVFHSQILERNFFFEPLSKEISAMLMDKLISKDLDRHYERTLGGGLISYQNSNGDTIVEPFKSSDPSDFKTTKAELDQWLYRAVKTTGDLLFKDENIFTNISVCLRSKMNEILAKLNPEQKTNPANSPNEPEKESLAQVWKEYADNVGDLAKLWYGKNEQEQSLKKMLLDLMLPDLQQSNKESIKTVKDIKRATNTMLCFNRVPCDDIFIRSILSSVDKALKVVSLEDLLKVSTEETESETEDSSKNVANIVVKFFKNRFDVIFTQKELELKECKLSQCVKISIIIPPVSDEDTKLTANVSIDFELDQEKLNGLTQNEKLELSAAVESFILALKAMECPPESYKKLLPMMTLA